MNFLLFLLFFYCSIFEIVTHRKHSKRTKKYNDFRKDMISQLPKGKTKLLDTILNRAVTEIMENMGNKRKKITSRNEPVFDLDLLPDDLQLSLRTMKRKLKNGLVLDPFDGQNDPYDNTDNGNTNEVTSFRKSNKMENLLNYVQQNGLQLSTRKNIHLKDNNIHRVIDNDIHRPTDKNYLQNQDETLISEEFRKDENNTVKRRKENRSDGLDNQDQVSEILPVNNGDIMLTRDGVNNEEIKLDVPNVYFDVKVNSSASRDKILKNLKDVINVMSRLKFNSDEYALKNTTLTLGDKRDGAEKLVSNSFASPDAYATLSSPLKVGSTDERLERPDTESINGNKKNTEDLDRSGTGPIESNNINTGERSADILPEHSKFIFPSHGSYFIQHGGNLYRIEKIHNIKDQHEDVNKTNDWMELKVKDSMNQSSSEPVTADQLSSLDKSASTSQPTDDAVDVPKLDRQTSKTIQPEESNLEIKDKQSLAQRNDNSLESAEQSQPIGQPEQETDNTYEIKHNNKIFRITEITKDKSQALKEHHAQKDVSPQSRSASYNGSTSSVETLYNTTDLSKKSANLLTPSTLEQSFNKQTYTANTQPSVESTVSETSSSNMYRIPQEDISSTDKISSDLPLLNMQQSQITSNDLLTPFNSDINNLLRKQNETIPVIMDNQIQENFVAQQATATDKHSISTNKHDIDSDKRDIGTNQIDSSIIDDDYVTYVFKANNGTLNDHNIVDSLNTTLSQDITP